MFLLLWLQLNCGPSKWRVYVQFNPHGDGMSLTRPLIIVLVARSSSVFFDLNPVELVEENGVIYPLGFAPSEAKEFVQEVVSLSSHFCLILAFLFDDRRQEMVFEIHLKSTFDRSRDGILSCMPDVTSSPLSTVIALGGKLMAIGIAHVTRAIATSSQPLQKTRSEKIDQKLPRRVYRDSMVSRCRGERRTKYQKC